MASASDDATIVWRGQTVSSHGETPIFLMGGATANVFFPNPDYAHTSLISSVMGTNTLNITEPAVGGYQADVAVFAGLLKLHADATSGARLNVHGAGRVDMTTTVGGRYGASEINIDVRDDSSNYFLISNATLNFSRMSFMHQAEDITLHDGGIPVANIGGPPPVVTVKGVAKIASVEYSDAGLSIDFASGRHTTAAVHIQDHQFYALTQNKAGDVTITASARWSPIGTGFEFVKPDAPVGGRVFEL